MNNIENWESDISKCPYHKLLALSWRSGGKLTAIKKNVGDFLYNNNQLDWSSIQKIIKSQDLWGIDDIVWLSKHLAVRFYKELIKSFIQDKEFGKYFSNIKYNIEEFDMLLKICNEDGGIKEKETNEVFAIFQNMPFWEWSETNKKYAEKTQNTINNMSKDDQLKVQLYILIMRKIVPGTGSSEWRMFSPIFGMISHIIRHINRHHQGGVKIIDNTKVPPYFYEKAKLGSQYHAELFRLVAGEYNKLRLPMYEKNDKYSSFFKRMYIRYNKAMGEQGPLPKELLELEKKYDPALKWIDSPIYVCPAINEFPEYYKLLLWLIHENCLENKDKLSST